MPLIAQIDDEALFQWLRGAQLHGGGFITAVATAALLADTENYPLLRPFLLTMRAKYPKYDRRKCHTKSN